MLEHRGSAFPSPLQPGPAGMLVAEAGMHSAWCQAPRRGGQPPKPAAARAPQAVLQDRHPQQCQGAPGEGIRGTEGEKSPGGQELAASLLILAGA